MDVARKPPPAALLTTGVRLAGWRVPLKRCSEDENLNLKYSKSPTRYYLSTCFKKSERIR